MPYVIELAIIIIIAAGILLGLSAITMVILQKYVLNKEKQSDS